MNTRPVFLALSFLLGFVRPTFAGVAGVMSDSEWFRSSNKILVLEYENPFGGDEGVQVSELIGRMALATATGVYNFAVITLRQEEDLYIPLTDGNVEKLGLRQRATVVIWGEFYKQNERIFVTSHLRYDLFGRPEKFSWDIRKLNITDRTHAYASLPAAQMNFSPLQVSSSDLLSLQDAWRKTLTLHALPDENSGSSGELELSSPYFIIKSSKGWSRVKTHRGPVGWVRLGDLSRLDTFNELSGVVCYAQGLMQFSAQNYAAAAQTFKKYLEQFGSQQDPANQAVARILIGYSILKHSGEFGLSLKEFEAAKALLPNSSSPVNCIALALFEKASRSAATEDEMKQLEKDLIRVIQIDNDVDAIRNLETLYQLPQAAKYFKNNSGDFMQSREIQLRFLRDLEQQVQQQPNS